MGDPLVTLLCNRESGVFTPDAEQVAGPPTGWVIGELVTKTKTRGRVIRAKVIARIGGNWNWSGGFNCPGTRHFDFSSWDGRAVVEADKMSADSTFAKQLALQGWEVTDDIPVPDELFRTEPDPTR